MEIQSPCILKSADLFENQRIDSSVKSSNSLSGLRYTPSRNQEEKSISLMDLFQDSLEISKPSSRLLEFNEKGNNSSLINESFQKMNSNNIKTHQRKASLSIGQKPATLTEMLLKLREKPKPKSSLKGNEKIKKQKTVSFCSQIELSSPDTLMDSVVFIGAKEIFEDSLELEPDKSTIATATNSLIQDTSNSRLERNSDTTASTLPNLDIQEFNKAIIEDRKNFSYEEDVRASLGFRESEFNEFSTVAFCHNCQKETVTEVSFEKIKGEGCGDIAEWIACWILPVCMYRKKLLLHKCAVCKEEIFKTEC